MSESLLEKAKEVVLTPWLSSQRLKMMRSREEKTRWKVCIKSGGNGEKNRQSARKDEDLEERLEKGTTTRRYEDYNRKAEHGQKVPRKQRPHN
jgi:hypothetical protein